MLPWKEFEQYQGKDRPKKRLAEFFGKLGTIRVAECDQPHRGFYWCFESPIMRITKMPITASDWENAKQVAEYRFEQFLRELLRMVHDGNNQAIKQTNESRKDKT